jgi:hypothetical protein
MSISNVFTVKRTELEIPNGQHNVINVISY